jgi:Ca2+-binding RTX toxin-like protein
MMITTQKARVGAAAVAACEALERRALLSATMVEGGVLTVYGTDGDDAIVVTEDASGVSVMMNGASAGSFSGISGVRVSGRGGNDSVAFSGSLSTTLVGGAGNDSLTGGSGADMMYGSAGMDVLAGGSGDDLLIGGADADVFSAGDGMNLVSLDVLEGETYVDGGGFDTVMDLVDDPGFALDPAPEPQPEPEPEPVPVCEHDGLKLGHYKNGKLCSTPPAAGCFKKVA